MAEEAISIFLKCLFTIPNVLEGVYVQRDPLNDRFVQVACFRVSGRQGFWWRPVTMGLFKNLLQNQTGEPDLCVWNRLIRPIIPCFVGKFCTQIP